MNKLFFSFTFLFSFFLSAQTLFTLNHKGSLIRISSKEFLDAYKEISKTSFNPPNKKDFLEDYIRFRIGVEKAYTDRSLVKSIAIKNYLTSNKLKRDFEKILYQNFAEKNLKTKMTRIDKRARKVSKKTLQTFYKTNPEFNLNFIVIKFPENPSSSQLREAKKRASSVYKNVKKSKKSFVDLIQLYSDDKVTGVFSGGRPKGALFPSIYRTVRKLRAGEVSLPIKTPNGFYIVKLNHVIPFSKANRQQLLFTYVNSKKAEVFSSYFNALKKQFKVDINKKVLKKLL